MIARDRSESRIPLPGGWLLNEGAADSRRYASVTLRPPRGFEEEWLAENHGEASAICTTRLLDACILGLDDERAPDRLAHRMLVGDRDYLMLQLRRLTLGDRVMAIINCPSCASNMDLDFDASSIPLEKGAPDKAVFEVVCPAIGPQPVRSVYFRLPCGADQEAVLDLDAAAASETVLERCLLKGDAPRLTTEDRALIVAEMEARAPRIDLELDLTCPECRHDFLIPFDTTSFFLDELRITGAQLLREVHCLALYYHWSEDEILRLNRNRRRVFLTLLSDLQGQE
jgi:hypothetical protein